MTEEQHRAHQRLISTLPVRNCGDGDEPENWAAEDIELSPQERAVIELEGQRTEEGTRRPVEEPQ